MESASLLPLLLPAFAFFLVYALGLGLSFGFRSRMGKTAWRAMGAFLLFLLAELGSVGIIAWQFHLASRYSLSAYMSVVSALSGALGLLKLVGWALLLSALVGKRSAGEEAP